MSLKPAKLLLLICSLFFLWSCGPSPEEKEEVIKTPDYLMEPEQFQALLGEVYLLESSLSKNITNKETPDSLYIKGYQRVFTKFNTNEEKFKKNFYYYIQRSEELDQMYEELIEELITKQGKVRALQQEQKKRDKERFQQKVDSIKAEKEANQSNGVN